MNRRSFLYTAVSGALFMVGCDAHECPADGGPYSAFGPCGHLATGTGTSDSSHLSQSNRFWVARGGQPSFLCYERLQSAQTTFSVKANFSFQVDGQILQNVAQFERALSQNQIWLLDSGSDTVARFSLAELGEQRLVADRYLRGSSASFSQAQSLTLDRTRNHLYIALSNSILRYDLSATWNNDQQSSFILTGGGVAWNRLRQIWWDSRNDVLWVVDEGGMTLYGYNNLASLETTTTPALRYQGSSSEIRSLSQIGPGEGSSLWLYDSTAEKLLLLDNPLAKGEFDVADYWIAGSDTRLREVQDFAWDSSLNRLVVLLKDQVLTYTIDRAQNNLAPAQRLGEGTQWMNSASGFWQE